MGLLAKAAEGERELLMQFLQVTAREVTHFDILQVVPTPFVPRIEVGVSPRPARINGQAAPVARMDVFCYTVVDRRRLASLLCGTIA